MKRARSLFAAAVLASAAGLSAGVAAGAPVQNAPRRDEAAVMDDRRARALLRKRKKRRNVDLLDPRRSATFYPIARGMQIRSNSRAFRRAIEKEYRPPHAKQWSGRQWVRFRRWLRAGEKALKRGGRA